MTQPPNPPEQPGEKESPGAPHPPPGPGQPASQQSVPQQQPQGQQGYYPHSEPKAQGPSFGAIFSFDKFQTPKHARTFFLLIVVLVGLWWFFGIIDTVVQASAFPGDFPIWSVLESLLFSWVIPLLVIVFGRLGVELTAAAATLAQKRD
ncbi:DUF4282 domain-containing protein [Nesterenkonia populi]